ncbi:hypothetical protein C0W59_11015 [Photobacterium kishitanii]|uniref:Eco47II family restriction endonuclease n=1 Tax=Photobacterium kishitanii TaxID=318456 RepID=UPI000D177992|nr:Eco47II family restriction endonuclease [Photobacterium kishitanii]PSV15266.1 hypothetical protein C0W59_11015 [Photobacterium kishitanii]
MNNKLPFISNDDLSDAIEHVTNSLNDAEDFKRSVIKNIKNDTIFNSSLFSNTIDPFAMTFGLELYGSENWLQAEISRQLYKTYEQKIGEFHQKILGSVEGWDDLGVGDESKVDLFNSDKNIYIELKNKYNTCNSDALDKVKDKLLNILTNNAEATAYWAFIIPTTKQRSGSEVWKKKKVIVNPRLYKAWGSEVYKIVTGDSQNLQLLYNILSSEIQSKLSGKDTLSDIATDITEECREHLNTIRERVYTHSLISKL